MPVYVAGQSVELRAGQNVAVLKAEDLGSIAATEAVLLDAGYGYPVVVTVINPTAEGVQLQVAAVNADADFMGLVDPISGNSYEAAAGTSSVFQVTGGLFYRLLSQGAITDGTIWIAR